jgi:hydrogenase small subunit
LKGQEKRTFRERLKSTIAHISIPMPFAPDLGMQVVELMSGKAPVVWIQGLNCTGCTCSLLDSDEFLPGDLAYDKISLRYQPDIMGATGNVATESLQDVWEERPGRYILVVEGAIPTGDFAQFCTFGLGKGEKSLLGNIVPDEMTIDGWIKELVPDAAAVIAVGNCASFGGHPMTIADVTGATPVPEVVRKLDARKPIINITGCPPHPEWLVGTLEGVLEWVNGDANLPELDEMGRFKEFYTDTVHDLCERLGAFKEKRFLEDWNDTVEGEDRCLLKLGCMGPKTHGDCPTRLWNAQVNWCVGSNSPCRGCTDPDFFNKMRHPGASKKKEE